MTIPDYQIVAELCRNEQYVVHRGRRKADGAPVLLKSPLRHPARPAQLEGLRREFALLRDLTLPGVPKAYDLFRSDGGCWLVLEDTGGAPLASMLATGPIELASFFHLALQLSSILAGLHRLDVIHKNVQPGSIFVHPATRELWLGGFDLASRGSGETQEPVAPTLLAGTLAYLSPEQTGRMNRAVDYRSDFYSLGVSLYELLTGVCPFRSDDPLELVHAHIAKVAGSPRDINPAIPTALAQIVLKLLAKMPEDRYQSALGLRVDLERCAEQWIKTNAIEPFPLGSQDVSDRFMVPQRLYGRETQLDELLQVFDRVCEGQSTLLLVAGYSGIGKTSLIQELYKPLIRSRGYFINGKFDQLERNRPYLAFIQAFQRLIQRWLTEGEERLSVWRTELKAALGANCAVIAALVPEIQLVLGKQPPPAPLGPVETLNRFQLAMQNFVGALTRKKHPLVIFLDDLQWAGLATLNLLQPLLTSPDVKHLLLIGAYRDNEVDLGHPLMRTVSALEVDKVRLHRITLGPLAPSDISLLVQHTLHRDSRDVELLARLIEQKTGGNPFFLIHFMKALQQEGLFAFDYVRHHWSFQLEAIARATTTDNVVDLMTGRIQRLSSKTQQSLALAACLGNQFDLATLAVASQQTGEAAAADLEEAIREGLVLSAARPDDVRAPLDPARADSQLPVYTFLHDRVQQAAYALISNERKPLVHVTLGRLLLARSDQAAMERDLFDIVHHLNRGSALISDGAERLALARLNLNAGRKAKSSIAYQAASGYLKAGLGLLLSEHWKSSYELMLELRLEAAECEYLVGDEAEAERSIELLLDRARTRLDKVRACALRIVHYEYTSRYADAVRVGTEALALFDLAYPDSEEQGAARLGEELATIKGLVGERRIDSLVDLPVAIDPEAKAAMKLLASLHTPCYLSGDKTLTLFNTSLMVRLSLERGYTEESALAFVLHAMNLGQVQGRYQEAYDFGMLAMRLNDRLPDPGLRAKILMNFSWAVSIWRKPVVDSFEYTREAFRLGNETGFFSDAAYALFNECQFTLLAGAHLDDLKPVCEAAVAFLERVKMHHFAGAPLVLLQWGRALQGSTEVPTSLTGDGFDEGVYLGAHTGEKMFEMFCFDAKLALLYTFEHHSAAEEFGREAERVIRDYAGTLWDALRVYYHALVLCALYPQCSPEARGRLSKMLEGMEVRLRLWAENCPHNYLARHLIVSAEIARIEARDADAMPLYEAAIAAGARQECPRELALANELCAKFCLDRGRQRLAAAYMAEACDHYAQWGALAKVGALRTKYAALLEVGSEERRSLTETRPTLDISTVTKAARAISSEIVLGSFLDKLLDIVIENAGAQRGVFLQGDAGRLGVVAERAAAGSRTAGSAASAIGFSVSEAIVNYVFRTRESAVVADAAADERFVDDPYVARLKPKSILCMPVIYQTRLAGILYMENNLATNAFTPERLHVMQILAAQAAISLENAKLYDEMKHEVKQRRSAEEGLRAALVEVEQLKNRLEAENVYLQEEIRKDHDFEEMVGNDPALLALLQKVERVAASDASVLIQGETGTGKELIARALHNRGARRQRALVKVNCGAISAGLVESELFGHVKGAFTGALARRVGRFELADGGTIFLDEVGELAADTQVKLLRVLQEQEFEPVGSNQTVRVNVRVIAATNRDLEEAVKCGRFRADLYYRLNVIPLRVPPLRERRSDIPQLAIYFLERSARKAGNRVRGIASETLRFMQEYPWPGNVRELQNLVERAVVLSTGPVLNLDPQLLSPASFAAPAANPGQRPELPMEHGDPPSLEEMQRRHILAVLEQTGWVIEGPEGAANILKLNPSTIRSRMKKLGIVRSLKN